MKHVGTLRGAVVAASGEPLSRVEARHRALDVRLQELGRHTHLTAAEEREVAELKKYKLKFKDAIAALRRG